MTYQLLPWIDENKLNLNCLCENFNPLSMEIIKKRQSELDDDCWNALSSQQKAKDFLIQNLDKIDYFEVIFNDKYADIIQHNIEEVNWYELTHMDISSDLVQNNLDKADWKTLSLSLKSYDILRENLDKINWHNLSKNKNDAAIEILRENLYKVDWKSLSANVNVGAIEILRENLDKVDWDVLSQNEAAIDILKDNPKQIVDASLWKNKHPDAVDLIDVSRYVSISSSDFFIFESQFKSSERHLTFLKDNCDEICSKLTPIDNPYYVTTMNNKDIIRMLVVKDKVCLKALSSNPNAIDILKENPYKIVWSEMCKNPKAYKLLMENKDKIDYNSLCSNSNNEPIFKDLILKNLDKVNEHGIEAMLELYSNYFNHYNDIGAVAKEPTIWRLEIIDKWIELYMPPDEISQDLKDKICYSFAINATKPHEIEFLKKWFNEDKFYDILSICPGIFV